ncbi:MAG: ATP-binding protein [Bryobacteraceae bacterium]|nr:ATP-binding protein [Bryobacteraceae bacterium]
MFMTIFGGRLALLLLFYAAASPALARPFEIFVLHSYHPSNEWTEDQIRGMLRHLERSPYTANTWTVFLDAERNPGHASGFLEHYAAVYSQRRYDLVIATDDAALELLLNHPHLFPNTPVAFSGVNQQSLVARAPRARFTGVLERFSTSEMVKIAFRLHPGVTQAVFLTDQSPLSNTLFTSVQSEAARRGLAVRVFRGGDDTFDGLLQQLRALPPDSLLFHSRLGPDRNGDVRPPGYEAQRIAAAAPVPVYGLATEPGLGFLAGSPNGGLHHGALLGEIVRRLLAGESPASIPVQIDDYSPVVFDARQLPRFRLSVSDLPPGVVLINDDSAGLRESRRWIFLGLAAAVAQFAIIAGLIVNTWRRRTAERALSESNGTLLERNRQLETALEAARAADEAKRRFVANMGHELRTPMNGVLGATELLLASPLSGQQREALSAAHVSARSLLALLNDVLEISRIESGRLEIRPRPVQVRELVGAAIRTLAPSVPSEVALQSSVAEDVPGWASLDYDRLRQVLLNLTLNAVKFTPAGTVRVNVSSSGSERLRLDVSDTGVGIPPDHLARIFERFYQIDSSDTRQFGGSGLGLAITREIVTAMGGDITVQSAPGQGSTFTVILPAPLCDPPQPPPAGEDPLPPGLRVLIVEDNRINMLVAQRLLEAENCFVDIAFTGSAGLDRLQAHPYDAVLMDVQMPEMDGLEATRRLRASPGPNQTTPVIALTASALASDREECLAAGMDAHLAKPVSTAELRAALRQVTARTLPRTGAAAEA